MNGVRTPLAGKTAGSKRAWRGGSIHQQRGRWQVVIPLPPTADGKRRRKSIRFETRLEAEAAMPSLLAAYLPQVRVDDAPSRFGRMSPRVAVEKTLERGRLLGWDVQFTALAVLAGVSKVRLQYGVTGPCAYCGDELASSVDHIVPGQGNKPGNIASACVSCNSAKGQRSPSEWVTGARKHHVARRKAA